MKCYRIRKKPDLLTPFEKDFMSKRNETDYFISDIFITLKGAKSALNNRNGYLERRKDELEIVEYEMIPTGVVQ